MCAGRAVGHLCKGQAALRRLPAAPRGLLYVRDVGRLAAERGHAQCCTLAGRGDVPGGSFVLFAGSYGQTLEP